MGLLNWLFGSKSKIPSPSNPHRLEDWRNSDAHLLLLSKFIGGSDEKLYKDGDYWEVALNEKPSMAIKRFVDEGYLGPLSLSDRMHLKFNVTDLKNMLKERGLRVSGRKDELVERLLDADRQQIETILNDTGMLKCSEEGIRIAEIYMARQKELRKQMESEIYDLLEKGQYKKALLTVGQFEASQVFSRGIGMDWNNYGSDEDLAELKDIFSRVPSILKGMDQEKLLPLRTATAMMHLLGVNKATPWLPANYSTGIWLDPDAAARMLLFYVSNLRRLTEMNEINGFIKAVEISSFIDAHTCPACRKIKGKKYQLNKALELPYPQCTSSMGCRCSWDPIFKK